MNETMCEHTFCGVNKVTNKPICIDCGMEAELYFERKFETMHDFFMFKLIRAKKLTEESEELI